LAGVQERLQYLSTVPTKNDLYYSAIIKAFHWVCRNY